MSELESIAKLRTAARNMAKGRNLENHEECNLLLIIADEIEAEVGREYMRLPVDAEGVPIHVGDELETAHGGKVIVEYVGECEVRVYRDGEYYRISQDEYAYTCRHVKPRTLDDVLAEFADAAADVDERDCEEWVPLLAKYADEIREMKAK